MTLYEAIPSILSFGFGPVFAMVCWRIGFQLWGNGGAILGGVIGAMFGVFTGIFVSKIIQARLDQKKNRRIEGLSIQDLRVEMGCENWTNNDLIKELVSRNQNIYQEIKYVMDMLRSPTRDTERYGMWLLDAHFPELSEQFNRNERNLPEISEKGLRRIHQILEQIESLGDYIEGVGTSYAFEPLLDAASHPSIMPTLGEGWQTVLRSTFRRIELSQNQKDNIAKRLLESWRTHPHARPFVVKVLSEMKNHATVKALQQLLQDPELKLTEEERKQLEGAIPKKMGPKE